MAQHILHQIRTAVGNLNPNEVRQTAEQRLHVGLLASSDASYESMVRLFCPSIISAGKLRECEAALHRVHDPHGDFQLIIYDSRSVGSLELSAKTGAFLFDPLHPQATIRDILANRED